MLYGDQNVGMVLIPKSSLSDKIRRRATSEEVVGKTGKEGKREDYAGRSVSGPHSAQVKVAKAPLAKVRVQVGFEGRKRGQGAKENP